MESKERLKMSAKTTFRSRGRLAGLIRNEIPAGNGQNPASRAHGAAPTAKTGVDEALYYRARLILGESLPRPGR
jgi:hypothetical protein